MGDVIKAVNGMPTTNIPEFNEATLLAKGALVDVIREGRHRFITVSPPGTDAAGNAKPNPDSPPLTQVAMSSPLDFGLKYVAVASMGTDGNALIGPMFAKSPYFAVVNLDTNSLYVVPNKHAGATGIISARWLIQNRIDAVITGRIGPRAFKALKNANVTIYAGAFGQVNDGLQAFREGKLRPTKGVLGARGQGL